MAETKTAHSDHYLRRHVLPFFPLEASLATRLAASDESNPVCVELPEKLSRPASDWTSPRQALDQHGVLMPTPATRESRRQHVATSRRLVDADGAHRVPSGCSIGLDALLLAINNCHDAQQWPLPVKQLQLVCVELCKACRALTASRVVVTSRTPQHLWLRRAKDRRPHTRCAERVASVRVHSISWETSAAYISEGSKLFEIGSLSTEGADQRRVDKEWWPPRLQHLIFGVHFNGSIDCIVWPDSLKTLTFGYWFNRAVDKVVWPASLQKLTFGICFNKIIDGVSWPPALRELRFGLHFNKPISKVAWPASLEILTFGRNFNQSLDNVVWPASLHTLKFGMDFDQVIDRVLWPAALQELVFGWCFNQSIVGVIWPALLERLEFGWAFNQPLENIAWPTTLSIMKFGVRFNRPIDNAVWPASLRQLTFGWDFNQPVVNIVWPASLQCIVFGSCFNQALSTAHWPQSLQQLHLSRGYTESVGGIEQRGVRIEYHHY